MVDRPEPTRRSRRWDQIRQARLDAQLADEPDPETVTAMSTLAASEAASDLRGTRLTPAAPAARSASSATRSATPSRSARIADELAGDV